MSVTPASLRALYPEFGSTAKYPDATINAWIAVATQMMNADRWGALFDYGTGLFVAHRIALQAKGVKAASFGKVPGEATGILTNKAADGVSAGYDASQVAEEAGGFWNLTTYGQEYIRQARLIGAGPVQVGVDPNGNSPLFSGAWAGPYYP